MNDREFNRRVKADVERILAQTMWGDNTIPPSAFIFEARPIDVEMWMHVSSTPEPHPSCVHSELVCACGSWLAHMTPYVHMITGESIPESIHCTSAFNTCAYIPIDKVWKMGLSVSKVFKVRETLHGDDAFTWPHILKEAESRDGRYLAELPMTREELVLARVTRFHNARRAFRKEFP
jgi:hypothetical protein